MSSIGQTLLDWDSQISYRIYAFCHKHLPWLPGPLKILEYSGFGYVWITPSICTFLLLPGISNIRGAATYEVEVELLANFVVGLLLDLGWLACLKPVIARARPHWADGDMASYDLPQENGSAANENSEERDDDMEPMDKYSFPSGHATRSMFIAAFARHVSSSTGLIPDSVATGVLAWSMLVCMSRVLCGRHRVLEVGGGACVGLANYAYVRLVWLERNAVMRNGGRLLEALWFWL